MDFRVVEKDTKLGRPGCWRGQ